MDKASPCYLALPSDVFGGYALVRSNLQSHRGRGRHKSRSPMANASRCIRCPKQQIRQSNVFTDVKDVVFDSTIRYDASLFESLHRVVRLNPGWSVTA